MLALSNIGDTGNIGDLGQCILCTMLEKGSNSMRLYAFLVDCGGQRGRRMVIETSGQWVKGHECLTMNACSVRRSSLSSLKAIIQKKWKTRKAIDKEQKYKNFQQRQI